MAIAAKKLKAFVNKENDKKPFGGKQKHGGGASGDHDEPDADDEGGESDHDEDDKEEFDEHKLGEIADKIKKGKGDKSAMKMAKHVDDDHNKPDEATDDDKWDEAKDAVAPHKDKYPKEKFPNHKHIVAHVYKEKGGEIDDGSDDAQGGHDDDEDEDEDEGNE